jgi:hypothetical protein
MEESPMDMTGIWISIGLIFVFFIFACQPFNPDSNARNVTLQVLNPRGEITLPPLSPPSKRIPDLKGKKIGLYWNEKQGGNHFWNGIEQLLKEKLPEIDILRYSGAFEVGDVLAAKMAKEMDAFLYGVGD